jgi:tetratricopeptide (TPR) repeat protein
VDDYFDLGTYSHPITTTSPQAQVWFDRGLLWCYGFHHEEAVRCFKNALEHDPGCAMAHWGVAYASGPFYNKPWEWFERNELAETEAFCFATVQKAIDASAKASAPEQALINALSKRHQSPDLVEHEIFCQWTDDYADAMRQVYTGFPDDLDVITLTAESLMNRTPWMLWDVHGGVPAENADTEEIIDVLSHGMDLVERQNLPPHAGMIHLWIHVWEMSPTPERSLMAADQLRSLSPENGHLLHMASHIDVLCGHYYEAVMSNNRAIEADRKVIELRGAEEFYTISCCHDLKLKMFAAMYLGQFKAAMVAMDRTLEILPDEVIRAGTPYMQGSLEGYAAMKTHILVRFGKWQEIVDEPFPEDTDFYVMGTAMLHYAKGIAHATLGNVSEADAFRASYAAYIAAIDKEMIFSNNLAVDVLAVGTSMQAGEIEYHRGNYEVAFDHLRKAIELEDNLNYSEPWDWMHPTRHAMGALSLEQGLVEQAAEAYEADLGFADTLPRCCQHPENVWALHGYTECLKRLGRDTEAKALESRLHLAMARADVTISSSCCCRKTQHCY